tara:strand:+ start:4601 stop:4840 length:240 start_codon:yes stop_codon:yes gene_type:complete
MIANTEKIILTKDDIKELTGYAFPKYQRKWLRDNGIIFLVGADGCPKVSCAEVENKLTDSKNTVTRKKAEPNFEALSNG